MGKPQALDHRAASRRAWRWIGKWATPMIAMFAVSFGLASAAGWTDEVQFAVRMQVLAREAPLWCAVAIVAALASDVFLPVPSSVMLVAAGWLGGLVWGTLLGTVGQMIGALLGYGVAARWGRPWVTAHSQPGDMEAAAAWMDRFGGLAVLVSRPVPMMTETVSLLAGLSRMPIFRFALWSLAGNFTTALVYAWAGSRSRELSDTGLALWACLGLPVAGWVVTWEAERRFSDGQNT